MLAVRLTRIIKVWQISHLFIVTARNAVAFNSWITMAAPDNFPSTLEGFGYAFNINGQLVKINPENNQLTDKPFEFNVSDNHKHNQLHYEALGEVIDQFVFKLLEEEGLKRFPVPVDPEDGEPQTFVFATPDFLTSSKEKPLLILIHGSGVVRAGQWARRLIINDCLDTGTQIPYIKEGQELGYNILVLNTNDNKRTIDTEEFRIRGSEEPVGHALYVWDKYVMNANPEKIAIVAHSFGGICTSLLAAKRNESFAEKVFAVAFTDSAHFALRGDDFSHLRKVGRNWCSSDLPLDTLLDDDISEDVEFVSAGHTQHEMTSATSFESVFKYIEHLRREPVKTDSPVKRTSDPSLSPGVAEGDFDVRPQPEGQSFIEEQVALEENSAETMEEKGLEAMEEKCVEATVVKGVEAMEESGLEASEEKGVESVQESGNEPAEAIASVAEAEDSKMQTDIEIDNKAQKK
ncbi:FAM172 family protein homolog CG10038 isoform X2 [Neocloeon triangulifer]|uniref:FAM172 family protein homolog CG10038 isoform X2 n=1 Tax=Neocloeon triangulifer TaxID=2078957 RepID=UPI00286F978C|nr:FAM172 family protein homolog CG10038 isoform X2 [Neocloeon triangulifer]